MLSCDMLPAKGKGNTQVSLSPKHTIIEAFFREFEKKVSRLKNLRSQSFEDEAFTLCIVYIDRLASGYYGGDVGKNRENFCRALRELTGNPLFAMLHPHELSKQVQDYFPAAMPMITSIRGPQPRALLNEAAVAATIQSSTLRPSEKQKLIQNLWRASIASICYEQVRCPEIHGPGSGGLDFDQTIYQGKEGIQVDFELVYSALSRILKYVGNASVQTGYWFANPKYPAARA
jgi:hypothetical protein